MPGAAPGGRSSGTQPRLRIKEAVSELKKVARKDKLLAAEGAVLFVEKVSPALEHVDSSSGAIGTAVNNAIACSFALLRFASLRYASLRFATQ